MEFKSEELQVRFTVPDHPTYRQLLAYDGARDQQDTFYEKLWEGARAIIEEWECGFDAEIEKDTEGKKKRLLDVDLDEHPIKDRALTVIKWAGYRCHSWRFSLDELPKNS